MQNKPDDYVILIPDMATIHFKFIANILNYHGYHVKVLYNKGRGIVDEGLKYVHNDACYPALLCIGQMIDALNSGEYDVHKTAVMITQTGGGCRASNYVYLLRKALDRAGYDFVPVIPLNLKKLNKTGIKVNLPMLRQAMAALSYGDLLMLLNNQVKAYEAEAGESEALTERWISELTERFQKGKGFSGKEIKRTFLEIAASYSGIKQTGQKKVRVGIVGEIYLKYSALANNNLEEFLYRQDCEVMVPGLLDFMMYCLWNSLEDFRIYRNGWFKKQACEVALRYLENIKDCISMAARQYGFSTPSTFRHVAGLADGVIDRGCKMGEGWLLPAEMMELIELGFDNIISVQPFGCLPNHIVAKGMVRKIKEKYPAANIVAVDYDPGATSVNQENRIKLMLAMAKEKMEAVGAVE